MVLLYKLVGLLTLIVSVYPFGQSEGITPALTVTVPIYQTVNFTCQGAGIQRNWLINGELVNDTIKQQRHVVITDVGNQSVLSIIAGPINDRVTLGCQIVNPGSQNITSATLRIIGISRTGNIQLFPKARNLTWSRPFLFLPNSRKLNITYDVQINNGTTISTTNTSLILNELLPCSEFTVTICACAGNNCSETTKTFSGNNTINIQDMNIENNNLNLTTCISAEPYTRFYDDHNVSTAIPMQSSRINYSVVTTDPSAITSLLVTSTAEATESSSTALFVNMSSSPSGPNDENTTSTTHNNNIDIVIAIGASVGLIVLSFLIVSLLVYLYKKRKRAGQNSRNTHSDSTIVSDKERDTSKYEMVPRTSSTSDLNSDARYQNSINKMQN